MQNILMDMPLCDTCKPFRVNCFHVSQKFTIFPGNFSRWVFVWFTRADPEFDILVPQLDIREIISYVSLTLNSDERLSMMMMLSNYVKDLMR